MVRSGALVGLIALGLAWPAAAQNTPATGGEPAVQTSPLPLPRTLRPPSDEDTGTRLPGAESAEGAGTSIETRPLDDLTAGAPNDPPGVNGSTAPEDDDPTGAVAVIRPDGEGNGDGQGDTAADGTGEDQPSSATTIGTGGRIALRPESDDDAEAEGDELNEDGTIRTRWQRARARRFRRAPKTQGRLTFNSPPPIVPIATVETELKTGARLRQLDKMTGQTETFEIAIGETRKIARLQVELDACRAPDDNSTSGTMAFVKVWDTKPGDDADPEFTGWMFADSPALSALDHPRYDLWVINCTKSAAPVSASTE